MTLKQILLAAGLILVLVSLACIGGGALPVATPTSPPPATSTPTPVSGLPQPDGLESVRVAAVVDGDTIELVDGRQVRYIGINTPERDQPFYAEATAINRQLVAEQTVQLEFDVETFDQYGRTLAYVWVNGVMANLEIVSRGFANAYTIPPNVRYEAEFRQAERAARQAERGLWAGSDVALKIMHIQADAPGSDNDNPNGEWIEIANQGDVPVQLQGYSLKDEANHIYTFGLFSVEPGKTFRIYSGQGQDSPTELYWGLNGESIWNNGSDAAFLRDAEGNLIDTYSY
jgi:micrococcal nuclease